jgi:Domain of unknown function (DUF4105)
MMQSRRPHPRPVSLHELEARVRPPKRILPPYLRYPLLALSTILSGVVIVIALWGIGAILYTTIADWPKRIMMVMALSLVTSIAIMGLYRWNWFYVALFISGMSAVVIWWVALMPSHTRDWDKAVAQLPAITITGNTATIQNVRSFTWRTEADADQLWTTRTIDLTKIEGVDMFFSYWSGPYIAHLVVSFPVAGETPVAFSIEIRREKGESYSPIAGFFKQYELAILAAEETDIIRLRTDVWREDVRLYRTGISQAKAQRLFRAYAAEIASLNATPRFYHTILSNCTTLAFGFARQIWPDLPLDWRVLVAGRAPELAYEIGVFDSRLPYSEINRLSAISAKAQTLPPEVNYSASIREGVPQPVIEP